MYRDFWVIAGPCILSICGTTTYIFMTETCAFSKRQIRDALRHGDAMLILEYFFWTSNIYIGITHLKCSLTPIDAETVQT